VYILCLNHRQSFLQLVYIVYSLRSDLSEEHTSTDDQHLRSFDDIFFFAKLLTLRSELDWGLHYSMASFLCGNGAKQLSDVSRQLAAHPAGGKTQLTEPNFCTDISWNITMYTVDYCVNILEGLLQNICRISNDSVFQIKTEQFNIWSAFLRHHIQELQPFDNSAVFCPTL